MTDPHTAAPFAARVRQRLKDGALQELIALAMDDLLRRRVRDSLDPAWMAQRWARGLRAAVGSPAFKGEVRRWLARLQADPAVQSHEQGTHQVDPNAPLRQHLPAAWCALAEVLLLHPWAPQRELVVRVLDHATMHALIQDVLQESLVGFARRMRSLAPDPARLPGLGLRTPPGFARLRALGEGVRAVGSTVASAMGSEIERQLEQRAHEFTSQALSSVLAQVADTLAAPEQRRAMADWRKHGLQEILGTPLGVLLDSTRDQELDNLASALLQALRQIADSEESEEHLTSTFRALMELEDDTWASLLERLGLLTEWQEAMGEWLGTQLTPLLDSTAFETWLTALLAP